MRINILPNGNLQLTLDTADEREELASECARSYLDAEACIRQLLYEYGFEQLRPEDIGALTDAPIFTDDADYRDDGRIVPHPSANVYWFPDYAVRDPWQKLADGGTVTLTKARE